MVGITTAETYLAGSYLVQLTVGWHGWWRIENQCMHGSVRTPASATTLGTYGVRQMLAPIASSTRVHAAPCRSTVAAYVIRPQISQQGLCVRAERSLRSSQACVRCLSCKRMEPSHSAPPCTSTVDRRRALGSRQQAVGRSPLLRACSMQCTRAGATRRLRLLVSFAAAALPVPACLPVHCCMRDGLLLQLARCSIAPRMPPQRTSLSTADADAGRTHCGVPTLSGLPSAAAVAVAVVLGAAAECGRTLLLCCC